MTRITLTQEQYRKQQRNSRWLHTAVIAIPMIIAAVSCACGIYQMVKHVG